MNDRPTDNELPEDAEDGFVDLTPDGDDPGFADGPFDMSELEALAEGGGEEEVGGEDRDPAEVSAELEATRGEVNALQAKLAESENKLLRTAADFQNFVRRSAINIDEAKQEAYMKVAKALVGVLDNYDRAMENFDPETASAADVLVGVESTKATLLQALASFGLTKIEVAPGDAFDPNLHEALMQQPSEEFESGQVANQFLPGYVLNNFPVRAAQVSVAQ